MKLKSFYGKNVRGYIPYRINFRDQLTFLIGINGSGKTTALKLISGLLTPSFYELSTIDYEEIKLVCEMDDGKPVTISATQKENKIKLVILIDKESVSGTFSYYNNSEISFSEQNNDQLIFEFDHSKVVNRIRKLEHPVILGINRRITVNDYFHDSSNRELNRRFHFHSRNYTAENVDEALLEIQNMLYSKMREISTMQEIWAEQFRRDVLKESLKIADINNTNFEKYQNYSEQLEKLDEREANLDNIIEELGIEKLKITFEDFFKRVRTILSVLSEKDEKNPDFTKNLMMWILNYWQLEKIDNITNLGIKYREKITKAKEPITNLLNNLNKFFNEGNKEVTTDRRGELIISIKNSQNNKRNKIYEISSGEKQLIIMLGHLALCSENNKKPIFIIDEPELSLHISWQELFVDALLNANKNAQFILATHAPSIIANNNWEKNCEDISEFK